MEMRSSQQLLRSESWTALERVSGTHPLSRSACHVPLHDALSLRPTRPAIYGSADSLLYPSSCHSYHVETRKRYWNQIAARSLAVLKGEGIGRGEKHLCNRMKRCNMAPQHGRTLLLAASSDISVYCKPLSCGGS